MGMQQRKLATTFTIELSQLERLARLSERIRMNRSQIVRAALERELTRYEQEQVAAEGDGRRAAVAGAGRGKKTSRRI